ncbi:MAG: alpha/beta hydrolase [bacterium]|nr:alpha/beta hydrolase [bacterium]
MPGVVSTLLGVLLVAASAGAVTVERDRPFDPSGRLRADVFVPDGPGPHPAVVMVHGGCFTGGSRRDRFGPSAEQLARAGFVAATIDYRLAPAAEFPAPVQDVKCALRWLKSQRDLRVDGRRVGLYGFSAGGYLAAFVGATAGQGSYDAPACGPTADDAVAAVVVAAGPSDWVRRCRDDDMHACEEAFLGEACTPDAPARLFREASVTTHAAWVRAPFLLLHGEDDVQVPLAQAEMLRDALIRAGKRVTFHVVPDGTHTLRVPHDAAADEAGPRILEFLRRTLDAPQGTTIR